MIMATPKSILKKTRKRKIRRVACDTETTGLYYTHGCKPFYVSTCTDEGVIRSWQWRVNPKTREVEIPPSEVAEITEYLNSFDEIVFQNVKFDLHMLEAIGVRIPPWKKLQDVLTASHCLNSAEPHGLKDLGAKYFDISSADQQVLDKITQKARLIAKKLGWCISNPSHPHFKPANGDDKKCDYHCDMWVASQLVEFDEQQERFYLREVQLGRGHTVKKYVPLVPKAERQVWKDAVSDYADTDAERTMLLFTMFYEQLELQGLMKQYTARRRALAVIFKMEKFGVSVHTNTFLSEIDRTNQGAEQRFHRAREIAVKATGNKDFSVTSPKQLITLLHDVWKLPVTKRTEKGNISVDEATIIKLTFADGKKIPHHKLMREFGECLIGGRKFSKTCKSLELFAASSINNRLYPSVNLTGTTTTRVSATNPPIQIVSKGRDEDTDPNTPEELREFLNDLWKSDLNIRKVFGPGPGRCWYSLDYSQLQLRIFAYVSDEASLIKAFEDGWDAHEYIAARIFNLPDGVKPNKMQRRIGKNVNFGFIFGAAPEKIESTAGRPGLWSEVTGMFPNAHKFMSLTKTQVRKHGFVYTPGGYKLMCDRAHKGVNYIVQGSEGEIVQRAMVNCSEYLRINQVDGAMNMQVHDELDFDMPAVRVAKDTGYNDCPHLREIQDIMEGAGAYYGMKTPVSPEVIFKTWDKGHKVTSA